MSYYKEHLKEQASWDYKGYGAVFVEKEEDIRPVYDYLVKQDGYWERTNDKNELIQLLPEGLIDKDFMSTKGYDILYTKCKSTGKLEITDVKKFVKDMEDIGINVYPVWRIEDYD